jgi:hypothetical protein
LTRMVEKGERFFVQTQHSICRGVLQDWRVWTQEAKIDELSIGLRALEQEFQSRLLTHYLAKWRASTRWAQRLERMMMLQEDSCLADLRLLAFYFDHWVIGKYNAIIESTISSRHDALKAGMRVVIKFFNDKKLRRVLRTWVKLSSLARGYAKAWARMAVLIGSGTSLSDAMAAEANVFMLKSRHELQTCQEALEDGNSRIMYLTLTPVHNKVFLSSEISEIRDVLRQTSVRVASMESKLVSMEDTLFEEEKEEEKEEGDKSGQQTYRW